MNKFNAKPVVYRVCGGDEEVQNTVCKKSVERVCDEKSIVYVAVMKRFKIQ